MEDNIKSRLKSHISRGEAVLFIGAGFSTDAFDINGNNIPDSKQLSNELWQIAFPDQDYDSTAHLGDTFYSAKQRGFNRTSGLISSRLSVDSRSLPEFYKIWFSVPWTRCYSLNIDDLEQAALRKFSFNRSLISISATTQKEIGVRIANNLEVVHLNGGVWDKLDDLTFSAVDYGIRLTQPDAWWDKCVADIMSRPIVFVGTELEEAQLWQYVQYRQQKGKRGVRELRPGSYLVCPNLNRARQNILRELNIDWVPMTASEFAMSILAECTRESELGHEELRTKLDLEKRRTLPQLVSDLSTRKQSGKTEYLMGAEPTWNDINAGIAIEREVDIDIYKNAKEALLDKEISKPLLLTGTAGSGKSTSLMRLGLKLSAEAVPVYWVDEQSNIETAPLGELITKSEGPVAIFVDDADLWGYLINDWMRELPLIRPGVLIALAIRSSKVESLIRPAQLQGTPIQEISMPYLADTDIEALIEVLAKENRLGVLKGMSHEQQVMIFRKEAGRQLLVAMIEATSGKRFEEKVVEEFLDLPPLARQLYSIICLVSSQRYTLDREDILLANGRSDNETLNELENLVKRNIVIRDGNLHGYRARHRVIAERVINASQFKADIGEIYEGVSFAFAARIDRNSPRTHRSWRRFIRFMSHTFIQQLLGEDEGRSVYEKLEPLLNWDYHYWLQRGSFEVQADNGDMDLATNFIGQARSISSGNNIVETEWAYLLMKKANQQPGNISSQGWFLEGFKILLEQCEIRGDIDPQPYHILGSQTLTWTRVAPISKIEKRSILEEAMKVVDFALEKHRDSKELSGLPRALKAAWLKTST